MAITTYEGLLETWADGIETVEQNLENLYGPATITPVLPSVTTEDGMLEAAAEGTELAAWNFAKKYSYLSKETNTTRIVDVPDTALYYGQLAKIGGQTVVESNDLMSAEVTSVISKKADGTTLQNFSIPAEIQALTGYGWSAGSVYNYIDFENKKFVQNVGRVDLGTLNWTNINSASPKTYMCGTVIADTVSTADATVVPNILCAPYITRNYNQTTQNNRIDKSVSLVYGTGPNGRKPYICDDSPADAAELKASLSGQYLFYELATPVETDISAYLKETDIKIEPGGTLTFDNSNDLDVPSEVKYIL